MSSSHSTLGALQTALDSRGTGAALSLCEAEVRNSPNDADAYRRLGQIHAMQGARQLALNASRRACELAPKKARNWCDLGRVHAVFAEFAPAVNCFLHAIQLDNKYADGWHNLGTALGKLGQQDIAFTALKTALSIDATRAENARAVQTPSRWQVRQPIYEKSVERWRHYAPHLPELERAFPLPDATLG